MNGEVALNASVAGPGQSERFSPVTLFYGWSRLERLLALLVCSCVGSTMNGFFVTAFFVEHSLKKVGNVFLACIGLADLIITVGVMPVSAVVVLSGEWDNVPVCRALHFLTEISTYCYSIFFTLVASETYYRLCRPPREYEMFVSMRVGLVSVLVYTVSTILAALGVYLGLDYDYCERSHFGNYYFRICTGVIFHGIPFILTLAGLIAASIRIRRRAREQVQYKRSLQYDTDSSNINLNIAAFLLFVTAWTPYLVVAHEYPMAPDNKYYFSVWIGVCRSVVTSILYGIANKNFRRAFAHIFNYCCCKSTLSESFTNRHRRALEHKPMSDVRVHIMHKAMNAANVPRTGCVSRETQEI